MMELNLIHPLKILSMEITDVVVIHRLDVSAGSPPWKLFLYQTLTRSYEYRQHEVKIANQRSSL